MHLLEDPNLFTTGLFCIVGINVFDIGVVFGYINLIINALDVVLKRKKYMNY